MTREAARVVRRRETLVRIGVALRLAGVRYWTASVMPALVGTTLPLWLRPPGFTFRWIGALEFLIATVLMHSGFSFLCARFERNTGDGWTEAKLLGAAVTCVALASVVGLRLLRFTPDLIFVVYGVAVMLAGLLYVAPPVSFSRRVGGEVVVSMSLGLLPVLGAYLVQTGDLTRTVYLAAMPIYAATLLWEWTEQMAFLETRSAAGSETLVMVFGPRLSGRVVVPGLSALLFATVLVAVLSESVMPLALAALVLAVPIVRIMTVSWRDYDDASEMLKVRTAALAVHSALCAVLIASSLWAAAN